MTATTALDGPLRVGAHVKATDADRALKRARRESYRLRHHWHRWRCPPQPGQFPVLRGVLQSAKQAYLQARTPAGRFDWCGAALHFRIDMTGKIHVHDHATKIVLVTSGHGCY